MKALSDTMNIFFPRVIREKKSRKKLADLAFAGKVFLALI